MALSAGDFAKRLYGADGAAEDCLLLQDEAETDVPAALFALYLAARGAPAAPEALAAAQAASERWAANWVRPLRALRRAMKPQVSWAMEAELPGAEIRDAAKALELKAEFAQLALLERLCPPRQPAPERASAPDPVAAAADAALAALCPAAAPRIAADPALRAAWARLTARAETLADTAAANPETTAP